MPATLRLRPLGAARGPGRRLHRRPRRDSAISTPTSCTSRGASATATRSQRELRELEADTYLIELKGAAIDLVAEDALARGRRVVLAGERRRRARARRGAARARPGGGDRLMHPHYRDPLPLGDPDGLPYSKGVMARALVVAGVGDRVRLRARDAPRARSDRDAARRAVELERLEEVADEVLGEAEGAQVSSAPARASRRCSALDVPIVLLVGGATGTGQVDGRDRGRAPARDHARHLDRLHPPDDPRVLPAHDDAAPSTTRASRPAAPAASVEAGFLEQTPQRARRRRGLDRAGAQRGLVDGDRGRPPRAGDGPDRDRRARCSSTPCFASRASRCTAPTSSSATRRPAACGRSTSTSTGSTRSGCSRTASSSAPSATACR